jgi:hypothetical protein
MIGHANQTIRHASGYVYTDSECSSLADGAFVEAIITYLTFMLNTLGAGVCSRHTIMEGGGVVKGLVFTGDCDVESPFVAGCYEVGDVGRLYYYVGPWTCSSSTKDELCVTLTTGAAGAPGAPKNIASWSVGMLLAGTIFSLL